MSKVATLMSSKLKVRKQIDCYGEEKKITLNKTAPYFSFETVKETFAGLRWWSKPPTIGKKSKHSNISHCFVLFVIYLFSLSTFNTLVLQGRVVQSWVQITQG